ncbi:MAG: M28 family peptidase [Bacteroidetes bacterium]|nr:M28 family peptidase [Bacteroidota bacterium]
MRQKLAYGLLAVLLLSTLFVALQQWQGQKVLPPPPKPNVSVPDFSADSAFTFVERQLQFGPRVPNTPAHRQCAAWYVNTFRQLGLQVNEQKFQATHFKGAVFNANNIMASYKPENGKRLLLAAHWDSRMWADNDKVRSDQPIDGADDGASGAAILIEIARILSQNPVDIGVDFLLFDAEDQGDNQGEGETWCLGSQYWSKNLPTPDYMPYQAVLLDMVGGKDARFYQEGISREVAPSTVDKIWRIAAELSYSNYFVSEKRPGITDDHLFVIRNAKIPMVDIISMPNSGSHPFPDHHHKHSDTLSAIDKQTLKAVGQTLAAFIYQTAAKVI